MAESSFRLKSMADMFKPTDPLMTKGNADNEDSIKPINNAEDAGIAICNLPLNRLCPFKNHPFRLYTGQRLDDMVESIKASGVLIPILVRSQEDFTYEILSGHNRTEAAKTAGLETIPAIVLANLSESEALLIVTETNLMQRSFADLSHSERAVTLAMHHDAIKQQGRRTDLIQEIENMLNTNETNDSDTSSPMAKKLTTIDKIGSEYAMSKDTVARYLRINKLIMAHKDRLDNNDLALRAAVTLSYLSQDEQHIVDDILDASHYKLDMKKAEALRTASTKHKLIHEEVEQILAGRKKPRAVRSPAMKLKPKLIAKYFTSEQKPDEIEATIIEALDFFYAHREQGKQAERN